MPWRSLPASTAALLIALLVGSPVAAEDARFWLSPLVALTGGDGCRPARRRWATAKSTTINWHSGALRCPIRAGSCRYTRALPPPCRGSKRYIFAATAAAALF